MSSPSPAPSSPAAGRPLRVLQLCAVDFTVRQFIAPLARALAARGFDVQCACSRGPHWQELLDSGVRMVEMPIARSANPLKALGAAWRLVQWLRRHRPDVLHVHTPVASMVGRLAGWLAGVPLVIYTAHGFYFHDRMAPRQRFLHVTLERFFSRFQHALFCVSAEDAAEAKRLGLTRPDRIFHVANGVAPARFDPEALRADGAAVRQEFGIPPEAAVVAIMGRLVREKGYAEFFAAARQLAPRLPHVRFLVIGDAVTSEHDNAKAEILAAAQAPELVGRVHFTGLRSDVPRLLAASDVFTLPSYREGMPVSILEAMMMGLPVVATRIRGCREEVIDGETGFLVEPRSAEELAGALGRLLDRPEEARRLGALGRDVALREYDEARILERQLSIYSTLTTNLR